MSACTHTTVVPAARSLAAGVITCNAPAKGRFCASHKPLTPTEQNAAAIARVEATLDAFITECRQALVTRQTPAIPAEAPVAPPVVLVLNERRPLATGEVRACASCGKGNLVHNTLCGKCRKAAARA